MARVKHLISAMAVILSVTTCGFPAQPPEKRASGPSTAVVDPDYVILRPVYRSSITGATPATIYGQPVYFLRSERILDLRHLDLKSVAVIETPYGSYAISANTNPAGKGLVRAWTSAHLGKQLGVFVDGRLISAPVIRSTIEDIVVTDFSKPAAEAIAARMRCGGAAIH
jgi:preprotein translocase subunit SecD